ncbi:MAG: hypothetical protein WBD53_00320 [Xanthobacteraceae bacterium]
MLQNYFPPSMAVMSNIAAGNGALSFARPSFLRQSLRCRHHRAGAKRRDPVMLFEGRGSPDAPPGMPPRMPEDVPMPRLPRILYAVPQLAHVHLEITKAIQLLKVANIDEAQGNQDSFAVIDVEKLKADIIRGFLHDLRKAGYRPDQPRWPKGSGDISGEWSGAPARRRKRRLGRPLRNHRRTTGVLATTRVHRSTIRRMFQRFSRQISPRPIIS